MTEVFEISAQKKLVAFQVGPAGKAFTLGAKEVGDVKVVFARDLSTCKVLCTGGNAQQAFDKLKEDNICEGRSLLDVFTPQLNPETDSDMGQQPLVGTKVHSYKVGGKVFEVYTGIGSEMKYVCERMQFFVSKLTEGAKLQNDFEADATQAFYTVMRDGEAWEVVGYASADEEYLFPDQEQLVIHQLCVLPTWQRNGHGSALAAVIWKRAQELNMKRVTWEPLSTEDEEVCDVEGWVRPMHMARMIKMGIFMDYDSAASLQGDAFLGNPMLSSWQKLRASKEVAYSRNFTTPPANLVWTRQGAEAAAAALLLPIPTVRELFEISLLKKDHTSLHVADFIKARLFQMDHIRLTAAERKDAHDMLQKSYNETYTAWKEAVQKTQTLRQAGVLPPV